MRLLLVRHGLTDWNFAGRFQGQADIPLNDAGRVQARALAERLATENIDRIFSSDLARAGETAKIIAAKHARHPIPDPRLRELDFGAWEGLTYDEIGQSNPLELKAWEADPRAAPPPGGESLDQLAARVGTAFEEIRTGDATGSVCVVAHGGPLQVLICLALGLPAEKYWQFHLAPASLSELALHPAGAIINLLNDTGHLRT